MCTNEIKPTTGVTKAEMFTAFNGAGYANVRNDRWRYEDCKLL